MKLLRDTENATNDRKFIKSQVEKRRRERMNRSLERLRTMLLQEPQPPGGAQHRVEKAEILEHTILFLQKTANGVKRTSSAAAAAAAAPGAGGVGAGGGGGVGAGAGGAGAGGQKHSFQDGFSTCLQTAAHFLGPERKGLLLRAALDASLATRVSRPDSDPAGVQRKTEASPSTGSLPHTKSILQMLRQKSRHRLHTQASGVAHPCRRLVQLGFPRIPQQAQGQNQLEIRGASKQSPTQSGPASQTLWRPWP